jgi:asparagine synthase (glutamine-hydrolysing)
MCGIAGFSGDFSPDILTKMGLRIAHRGPDDAGELLLQHDNNQVGLVHRRLSIIDLSPIGKQPFSVHCSCCQSSPDASLWLTYNGELYNYQNLRAELVAKGHQFKSQTDSEVLLHLYAEEGVAMLERLNGIFAFAIYDGRKTGLKNAMQTGDLFLARDGVGVKPLYYSETSAGFLFASELKALLAAKEVSNTIDFTAMHYYLAYLWCPGEQTALQSVKKFNAGEAMIVRNGHIKKRWFFYDLPYAGMTSQASLTDISTALDTHLTNAVQRQLVADVPVGAFLSGGLDSSAIVAMMRKIMPAGDINCYCIGFKENMSSEGFPDDVPYARKVAKHLKVNLQVMEVEADIIQHLQKMLYHLDEPQADPAPIHVYLIAEAARRDGIKVLLSGAGGDDIFSGYNRHRALQLEPLWENLPLLMRKGISQYSRHIMNGKQKTAIMQKPLLRRMAKLFAHTDMPQDNRIASHFLWSTDQLRQGLYSAEMTDHLRGIDTLSPLVSSLERIPAENNALNRMLYLEGKHFLASHNLNYTDKMSMASGLEVRVPLLDPDLIQFATQIPAAMKQKGKIGKAIFKKTMEKYLPHDVIYRKKAGFGAPLRRWLHHELKDFVQDTLSETALKRRGIFDSQAVAKLIKLDKERRVDGAYTIFSILCIEMWSSMFVDDRAAVNFS